MGSLTILVNDGTKNKKKQKKYAKINDYQSVEPYEELNK